MPRPTTSAQANGIQIVIVDGGRGVGAGARVVAIGEVANRGRAIYPTPMDAISPGLYRTTQALPGHEQAIDAGVLVYVGQRSDGHRFVVRPGSNRKNRWFWGEPTLPLPATSWVWSLRALPAEGYYTLPETLDFGTSGRWLQNAIVQLGYNEAGRAILVIAEEHADDLRNALVFSSRGRIIEDALMDRLIWAPILPVAGSAGIDPAEAN